MRLRFWMWIHDALERMWHWVYRHKVAPLTPLNSCFQIGIEEMGTVYWSNDAKPDEYPKMEAVSVDYYRVNRDGSLTLLDGPTDTAVIR